MIRLLDCSLHESRESAKRHLINILSSGVCLELFEELAQLNTLAVRNFFVSQPEKIEMTMQIIRELAEVENLKNKGF